MADRLRGVKPPRSQYASPMQGPAAGPADQKVTLSQYGSYISLSDPTTTLNLPDFDRIQETVHQKLMKEFRKQEEEAFYGKKQASGVEVIQEKLKAQFYDAVSDMPEPYRQSAIAAATLQGVLQIARQYERKLVEDEHMANRKTVYEVTVGYAPEEAHERVTGWPPRPRTRASRRT